MEVEAFGHAFVALKWQICKPKLWSYVFEINIPTRRTQNSHIYLIQKKKTHILHQLILDVFLSNSGRGF